MRTSTRGRRALAALLAATVLLTGALATSSAAYAAPAPASITKMAALGDSITQALMTCKTLAGCSTNSWATGSAATVNSHATRLKAAGATGLLAYNYSASGAASAALPGQAQKAVAQGAQYVTVQIGANDACTKSVSSMTTTATYRTHVASALSTLAASGTEIFVASIPSLQRMYDLNRSSLSARLTWGVLGICQSMLASPSSTKTADVQRRAAVQTRVDEFNAILADVCGQTAKCRYDGGAVANYQFAKSDISTRDYFHPSLTGQATLAAVTWPKTQWAS